MREEKGRERKNPYLSNFVKKLYFSYFFTTTPHKKWIPSKTIQYLNVFVSSLNKKFKNIVNKYSIYFNKCLNYLRNKIQFFMVNIIYLFLINSFMKLLIFLYINFNILLV